MRFGGSVPDRLIDLYYRPSRTFGWINELKIGYQSNSTEIQGELFTDEILVVSPGVACHPRWNKRTDRPCDRVPIKGYDYMFRYDDRNSCQLSVYQILDGNLCPNQNLLTWIFHDLGRPPNLVFFYYLPQDERQLSNIYSQHKAQIRNALESNSCPYKALDATGLPIAKYRGTPGC